MGRGRQKAKQTRAARKLKYLTTDTDYSQLQEELSNSKKSGSEAAQEKSKAEDKDLDDYASWAAKSAAKAGQLKENVNSSLRAAMAKMAPSPEKEKL
ncbi:MAG: DUF3073 domain-containing protein [Aeriscardovia sp.]|nr:DUF3073 domain-containing protein [Aeriscardovia sp.]